LLGSSAVAIADTISALSPSAETEVAMMGKSLSIGGFSFHLDTIREYIGDNGQPLHIFHSATVLVRRPDRLGVTAVVDDGRTDIVYNGRNLIVCSQATNKYLRV
jgi:hypothetical protein